MSMADFEDYLSIELKSEMANSYFGFRKLIEEDTLDYEDKVRQYSFFLEKRISFDLVRIYILLREEELIDSFLQLSRLEKKLFYDPYLVASSPIRDRVFESVRMRGLTRQGRFQNFLLDCYDRLCLHVETYRKKYKELQEIRADIAAEIKVFEGKHDIAAIMTFLHSLGAQPVAGHMDQGLETGVSLAIAKKLKIEAPEDVEYHLPLLPEIPGYQVIKSELLQLSEQAYSIQDESFLVQFANNFFRPRP